MSKNGLTFDGEVSHEMPEGVEEEIRSAERRVQRVNRLLRPFDWRVLWDGEAFRVARWPDFRVEAHAFSSITGALDYLYPIVPGLRAERRPRPQKKTGGVIGSFSRGHHSARQAQHLMPS